MTKEEIETMMNSTFSGLALFCRDLELDSSLLANYKVGQIIMERGFTDLTHRIGGLEKSVRYLVASSNGKDISGLSQNPEFGHVLLQSGAYFKVLDIQKEDAKTQVLLLHIPEEGVEVFEKVKVNIEDQVIERGITLFKENLTSAPIEDLQSNDWVERTSFPLGMNSDGELFFELDKAQSDDAVEKDTATVKVEQLARLAKEIKDKEEPKPKKKGFWSRLFGK